MITIKRVIDLNSFLSAEDFMANAMVTGVDPYNSHDTVKREAALVARSGRRASAEEIGQLHELVCG